VAKKFGLSREEQDAYAALSQEKAEKAIKSDRFKDEIVPVMVPQKKGDPISLILTSYPKFGTTAEKLGKLKPAFDKKGSVTAGNSSGVNDGAAALLVMSADKAYKLGIKRWQDRLVRCEGCEPELMGIGPIFAYRAPLPR